MEVRKEIDKFNYRLWQTLGDGLDVLEVGIGSRPHTMLMFDNHNYFPTDCVVAEWVLPEAKILDVEEMDNSVYWDMDVIIANQVLEHVSHPAKVMASFYKHLADGGILAITTPFNYRLHEFALDNGDTIEEGVKDYWRFTPNGYRVLFQDAGFESWYVTQIGEDVLNPDVICGLGFKRVGNVPKEMVRWIGDQELPTNWDDLLKRKLDIYKKEVVKERTWIWG